MVVPGVGILPGGITRLVTTNRIIREPTSIVGRLIRGSVSTNTSVVAIRVGGNNVSCVHVASGNYKVRGDSIPLTFLHRTADGVGTSGSLGSVSALKFHNRTLTTISSMSEIRVLAYCRGGTVNARCIVRNKRRVRCRRTNYPGKAAVVVHSLFCGAPTEVGFLGGSISRTGTYTTIISHVTLSRPRVSFGFVHSKGRALSASNSKGVRSTICDILKHRFSGSLVRYGNRRGKVAIFKLISGPIVYGTAEGDRFAFLGKHLIHSNAIVTTIRRTCGGDTVINGFPTFMVCMGIPCSAISMGIRPTGARIHFSSRDGVFRDICSTIGGTLSGNSAHPRVGLSAPAPTFGHFRHVAIRRCGRATVGARRRSLCAPRRRMAGVAPGRPGGLIFGDPRGPAFTSGCSFISRGNTRAGPVFGPPMETRGRIVVRGRVRRVISRGPMVAMVNRTFGACVVTRVNSDVFVVSGRTTRRHVLFGGLGGRRGVRIRTLLAPVGTGLRGSRCGTVVGGLSLLLGTNFRVSSFNTSGIIMHTVPAALMNRGMPRLLSRVTRDLVGAGIMRISGRRGLFRAITYGTTVGTNDVADGLRVRTLTRGILLSGSVLCYPRKEPITCRVGGERLRGRFNQVR